MRSLPPPRDLPSLAGLVVGGKFRVLECIGSGGMGTVWSGVHVGLGTRVAIKFIHPRYAGLADARHRFALEARAAAKLNSRHAVQVFDSGATDDGLAFIVMEYLEGEALSDAIVRRGPLPPREVARLVAGAASALTRAHAVGVVHRDLKPDNIFLANDNDAPPDDPTHPGYTVKLVDFGIAKMFEAPVVAGLDTPPSMSGPTRAGAVIGTPNFMAPEQLTTSVSPGPLTDLWSLGACAFAAMTGRIPFEGDVLGDIVVKVCVAPLPIPSQVHAGVPMRFDDWFARACSRDPSRRFQTAAELASALNEVCDAVPGARARARMQTMPGEEVQYRLTGGENLEDLSIPPPPTGMSPKTALLAGLVLGVTMMVGVAGVAAWRNGEPSVGGAAAVPSAMGAVADGGPDGAR